MVLLSDINRDELLEKCEEFRQGVEQLSIKFQDISLPHITISIGVAIFPDHGRNSQEIIEAADRALYQCKDNGRNAVWMAADGIDVHTNFSSSRK